MSGHVNFKESGIDNRAFASSEEKFVIHTPFRRLRRFAFFGIVALSSVAGTSAMALILLPEGLSIVELTLLIFFSITFSWIATSFWNGFTGFVLRVLKLDPLNLKRQNIHSGKPRKPQSKTAVVMPIYNEDPDRVIAGFRATLISIAKTSAEGMFDFYLLSDTQDPKIMKCEDVAWKNLMQCLPHDLQKRCFYRRREHNTGRKVGNIADFCEKWGSYYEFMVVLDADSVMTGTTIIKLVNTLEDNPNTGLLQTVPIPVRQQTFFGRYIQYAAALQSPMLATGLAFWQTDSANYWGHNAIIRIQAFMDSCGLPTLPGRGPFSGDILSHDFVEAALLRRAGWHVFLLADVCGSYEEVPSNLIEYAIRDRRWVQGNIQHLGLLGGAGLHKVSRLHFFFGAIAYITTLLWLAMLFISTADVIWRELMPTDFFTSQYQLFPDWPVDNSLLIFSMFYLTATLLLLPKILAYLIALLRTPGAYGGIATLTFSSLAEILFSILIAPIMMAFHSFFVMSVILGFKVGWSAQQREQRIVPWKESLKRTSVISFLALLWSGITFFISPAFFTWLLPVFIGMILAAPIIRFSSSKTLGKASRKLGLFLTPNETQEDPTLEDVKMALRNKQVHGTHAHQNRQSIKLPPTRLKKMKQQSFDKSNPG